MSSTPKALGMFPGQGSQRAGMAEFLLSHYPEAAGRVFDIADRTLGFSLTELCVSGSATEIGCTEIAQPAIVATSLAILEVLSEKGFRLSLVTGHSLGEYTALVAAGVLEPGDAFGLVRRRGELMARVSDRVSGAMVAIFGLPVEVVEAICAGLRADGVAEVANHNEAGQTVISGTRDAVARAARIALGYGAERVVELDVSAPFHCSLMHEIEGEFAAELDRYDFAPPRLPVLSSVTGEPVTTAEEAKWLLRCQLAGPVRWVDVLTAAQRHGITDYVEIGPGRVLSGLANRMVSGASVRSTNDKRRVAALLQTY
ncbi:ACP S-malonyltransferase [Nocardia sp. NPDC058497]|uniref:ACP S-malonyltransferase n=1 Tax=Nocardia sp. NPDC058497 TaxID=3346529 RepID=UPI0036532437